jgi:hypothetical protein
MSFLCHARTWAVLAGIFVSTAAGAAGGHHAVDDANIADPGTCKVESWLTSARDSERLLHAGGGCRVGPVELNGSTEYARADGGSQTGHTLQGKWATALRPGFSAGLSAWTSWQAHLRPRWQGSTVSTLFSWKPQDDLALHLNLGRDFVNSGPDQGRSGVSVEWAARPGWSIVGERYLADGTHFVRVGARRSVTESWTVDLSRAQRLSGPGASNWTLGAAWQFSRL